MFKKLLIAIDGSELAGKALAAGLELARSHGATVLVLTATDPVSAAMGSGGFGTLSAGPVLERLEESYAAQARLVLDAARGEADRVGLTVETIHVPRQRPADAIIETAKARGADTIIMGSHGHRGFRRLILGSQAAEVLARSEVPVLIIK